MRMLYHLQIPGGQKIALMGVFALGGFVVITGMIRLNFLKKAQNAPDPSCKHILFRLVPRLLSSSSSIHPDRLHRQQLQWGRMVFD